MDGNGFDCFKSYLSLCSPFRFEAPWDRLSADPAAFRGPSSPERALKHLAGPSDNLATPDNKPQSRDSVDDRRLARICEHRSESQTDPSALIAGLSGVNADLLELAMYISEPLLAALHAGPRTIENVEEKTSAINQLVRVAKQMAQLSQLLRQHGKPPVNELAADRNRAKRRNRDLLPQHGRRDILATGGMTTAAAISPLADAVSNNDNTRIKIDYTVVWPSTAPPASQAPKRRKEVKRHADKANSAGSAQDRRTRL